MSGYSDGYEGGYASGDAEPLPSTETSVGTPDAIVEFAFEDFGEEPTWYDESGRHRRFSLDRGAPSQLDEVAAGRLTLTLDDRDGHFDPDNEDGPYYGRLLPRRWVRVSSQIGDGAAPFMMKSSVLGGSDALKAQPLVVPLITAFVSRFPQRWNVKGPDATVDLQASDGLSILAGTPLRTLRDPITGALGPEPVSGNIGDAILQVLAQAGWPGAVDGLVAPYVSTWIDVDVSRFDLEQPVALDSDALPALQMLARSDGGRFYISRDGKATFRSADRARVSAGTWGDGDGELPYADITDEPEAARLLNVVTVTSTTGESVTRVDSDSRRRFGVFEREFQVAPIDGLDLRADEILGAYSKLRRRITGLAPLGRADRGLYRRIHERELGDVVGAVRRPPRGGVIDRSASLEGIHIEATNKRDWRHGWNLSEGGSAAPNLLTPDQASLETSADGWAAESGCTIVRSTVRALVGEASLEVFPNSFAGGDPEQWSVRTVPTEQIPAAPGDAFSGAAWCFGPGLGPHQSLVAIALVWFDADLDELGASEADPVPMQFNRWKPLAVSGVAPASTAFVGLRLFGVPSAVPIGLGKVYADLMSLTAS